MYIFCKYILHPQLLLSSPLGDLLSVDPAPVDGGMSPVILKFLQAMVDESTEDLRMSFNRELMHLYTDILRQLSLQEVSSLTRGRSRGGFGGFVPPLLAQI